MSGRELPSHLSPSTCVLEALSLETSVSLGIQSSWKPTSIGPTEFEGPAVRASASFVLPA